MSESKQSGGIGFFGLLQLMFIGLKLCNQIQWSWWWVFSPTIATAALCVLLLMLYALVLIVEKKATRR